MRRLWTVLAALATLSLTNCGYNVIQSQDEQVKSGWSEVVNQYQRRADLVPNLVNSVKGFAQQEKEVSLGVTNARVRYGRFRRRRILSTTPALLQNSRPRRACRGVPAGPLAGVYFDKTVDKTPTRTSSAPRSSVPGCLARVRDRQARPGRRPRRPQAQAVGHGPAQGPRLGRRQDPRGVRRLRVDPGHPGEGPHRRPGRRPARHLPQAAPGRAADPRGRPDAARQPLLQPEALRPGQGRPLQGQQEARARPAAALAASSPSTTSSRPSGSS